MSYLHKVNAARDRAHETINHDVHYLLDSCAEDPLIAEFVDLVLDYTKPEDTHYTVGNELRQMVWDITQAYDLQATSPNTLRSLVAFISNWFLDDSSFSLKMLHGLGTWEAYNDNYTGKQDPQLLIDAARFNLARYIELDIELDKE